VPRVRLWLSCLLVSCALGLLSAAGARGLTGTVPDPSVPGLPVTTVYRAPGFDNLPVGPMSAAEFRTSFGGQLWPGRNFDDSSVQADSRGTGKVYRLKLDAGTIRSNPAGNNGIVVTVPLSRAVDVACLSYEVRFDPRFDWSKGGKLPGLSGVAPGIEPTLPAGGGYPGDKGWSGRLMWNEGGRIISYLYGPRQRSFHGDSVPWNKAVVAGRWHTIEQCYVMNTVGLANGRLQTWFDGAQVLNVGNMVWRTRYDVHATHLMWSVFRGGSTLDWAGSRSGHIDFDDVRVTTLL
jgi:hypothetical protein